MRRFLVPVVAAIAFVVPACGGGGDDPVEVVRAAATKTAGADSSHIALTVEMEGADPAASGTITATGAFRFDPPLGTMTMDMSGIPGAAGMGTMEAVVDGTVVYMKFPAEIAAQLPGGKAWVKLDMATIGDQVGVDFAQLMQTSQSDPTQALQYLQGASDDIEEVDEEQVRGVDTTHYRGTVDLRRAAAQYEGAQREALESAIELLGTDSTLIDVWIDDDGLARKMHYSIDLTKASNGEVGTTSYTFEMFDFGVEVDVEPPPADQVTDLASLFGGAAG
jgi:hypothetical protein